MGKKADINESLAASLIVALKLKSGERGPFALKALDFGEEFFNNHITALTERSANRDTKIAEQAQAVVAAQAALVGAEKTMEEKTGDLQAAFDLLNAAKKEYDEAAVVANAMAAKIEEFSIALNRERENLVHTKELSVKFELLKERQTVASVEAPTFEEEE